MYKKTITYTDYDGKERTEDCYFHLNRAEIIKWMTTSGGYTLDKLIEQLTKEENGERIMEIFDDLLLSSYGVKSLDGRQFIKNEEVVEAFKYSEAYSAIFTDLVTDAKRATEFITSIIPSDMAEAAEKLMEKYPEGITEDVKTTPEFQNMFGLPK